MANKPLLDYSTIVPANSQKVSHFLIKHFFPNEPISRAFGLPIDQVTRWFPAQIRDCLGLEASVCATDVSTGEIVGIAINIIAEKKLIADNESKSEGRGLLEILDPNSEQVMIKIAKFLGTLNQVSDDVYKSKVGTQTSVKTFNCVYLAVLPSHGGRGIGKRLIEESEKSARKRPDISLCQVDTTSEFSYRIFKSCGYQVIREIDLAPFIPGIEMVDNGAHKKGRILLKELQ